MAQKSSYDTDLSDSEWEHVKQYVPPTKKGGRPAKYMRRALVDAILYVRVNKLPWRAIPDVFPPWNTVYVYYNRWLKDGNWNNIWLALPERLKTEDSGLHKDPNAMYHPK